LAGNGWTNIVWDSEHSKAKTPEEAVEKLVKKLGLR